MPGTDQKGDFYTILVRKTNQNYIFYPRRGLYMLGDATYCIGSVYI